MSDWEVGDYALCVRGGCITPEYDYPGAVYPEAGNIYLVNDVDFDPRTEILWLEVIGAPDNIEEEINYGPFWAAERFIKITPESADEFDRETIALMKEKVA